MASILTLIFVFFIAIFIILGWTAYNFYRQIRKNANRFQRYGSRQANTPEGDTIIDNRSEAARNKQVIKDSEGEYVDFTEVNNKEE